MFIRVKSTPNSPRKSIQIVENIRTGERTKQKIVRHVGIIMNEKEESKMMDLAADIMASIQKEREDRSRQGMLIGREEPISTGIKDNIKRKTGRPKKKLLPDILPVDQVTLDMIVEEKRVIEGVHEVAGNLYDQLGYNNILKGKYSKILKDIVLARLVEPSSKMRSQKLLEVKYGNEYELGSIYRMMDDLHAEIDTVKGVTFNNTQSLCRQGINLALFDVTTLHFESEEEDDLRKFGYSKNFRFNTTQVVLALATNEDGLPIGYELFEGNKAEVKTLIEAIDKWREKLNITSVCFIGDRAMFSKDNLKQLRERHYQYMVATPLRKLSKKLQNEILQPEPYKAKVINKELTWIGEFECEEQRLIVSYNSKRARKDAYDRQSIIDKIKNKIGNKEDGAAQKFISNTAIKKYTSVKVGSTIYLDDTKIANQSKFDGLYGIITNIEDEVPEALMIKHRRLWMIEEAFRVNKHNLKMRPIYHWKKERIESHIAICYIAFALIKHLQYRVLLSKKISIQEIIDELLGVQASIYKHITTGDLYRVPGKMSNTARKIYQAFAIQRSCNAAVYIR